MALDVAFIIVSASLIIQVVVLFLVLYGYRLSRRLKFRQHGVVMATAVFVQLAAVFAIMVPSFIVAVFPHYIVAHPLKLVSVVSLFHEVTGALAFALGVWFVGSWRFRKNFKGCFNRRKPMVVTIVIWVAALIFGIALYTIFNWAILTG
jgi:hypothetical protein